MKNALLKCMAVAASLVAFSVTGAYAGSDEVRHPFGIEPDNMVGINMTDGSKLHDIHVSKVEELGKDCTVCHFDDNYEVFMAVDKEKSQSDKEAYVHKNCVGCHKEMGGPNITACRSCHTQKYAAK